MTQQVAIVLGGTEPHIHLIDLLQKRGFYVILADYTESPIAKPFADEHAQISTLDQEAVLKLAQERKANLVISACVDQANAVACYVAEKLDLPKPYNYETARNVTEKNRMKWIMKENAIPTSDYIVTDGKHPISDFTLCYPIVVKPVDANSSKGVKKVSNPADLEKAINNALRYSRQNLVIIEEFISGKEIQMNCLVQNGKTSVMMTQEKRKVYLGESAELQSIGSRIPAVLSDEMEDTAQRLAEEVASAFSLNNTPFFIQAIIGEKGMKILEFAPRVGGGLSYAILQKIVGYDPVEAVIDSYIEGGYTYNPVDNGSRIWLSYMLYAKPCLFDCFSGVEELCSEETIDTFYFTKARGIEIGPEMSSGNRIGAFLLYGRDLTELQRKNDRVREALEAYDTSGKPVLRKDLIQVAL